MKIDSKEKNISVSPSVSNSIAILFNRSVFRVDTIPRLPPSSLPFAK